MSHFTVLVIGEGVDEQMQPFWELDMPPSEAEHDERAVFSLEFTKEQAEKDMADYKKKEDNPKFVDQTLDVYMKDYHGYRYNEKEGGYGYWYNPNAHWDWYSIGGRWSGFFKLKKDRRGEMGERSFLDSRPIKEGYADIAKKCDIDWGKMKLEAFNKADENWKKYLSRKEEVEKSGEKFEKYWEFGIREGETKAYYIKRMCSIYTYAVVKGGEWYQKGVMGWWGMSYNEKNEDEWEDEFQKLIDELPEDTLLTVCDCHI
jgi:hypothetical protein